MRTARSVEGLMANELNNPMTPGSEPWKGDSHGLLQQAVFALGSERPREAEQIAATLLKADPRHARALYIFGCALLMQGRAQDSLAPLESAAHGRHDAEFDTALAIALQRVGRNEDALRRLKLATKRRPPHAAAFKELGALLTALGQYDEAVAVLRRGIEVAPMLPQLAIQLGYALLNRRRCADAKAAFVRALALVPTSPDALFGMAKAHQEIGESAEAAEYFRRCLEYSPGNPTLWLGLGHCLLELGQLDAGYECFRSAARGDPKRCGRALNSLAAAARGRFWLRPSAAARYLQGAKS
jgi:tetratricopeptide (TPR) repeat protein